ncbi:Hypothetical predicted protein [Mytilus galloprovincialis]|uniref:Uncharacterized protein n=1 Tax=Mytilus galloprovincialis TaxID=29158 RepID=A0A8B6C2Y5_MYTGA|nr:Hypothetical predicted protein [Mytilus galloprovincialis]
MEKKIKSFTYISKDGTILRDHIGRIEKVKSAASKIIDEVKNKTSRKDISKKNETNEEDIDDSSTEEISKTIYKNFEEGPISSNRKRTFCSEKSAVDHLGCYTQAITDITLQEDAGLNLAQSDTKDKSAKTDIRGKSFREDNLKYNVGTHGFVLGNSGFGTNLLGLRTETKAEAETRLHGDASMELTNSYINESTAITDKKGNTSHKNQSQKIAGARGHIVGIAGIKTNVLGCKIEPEADTRLYGDAKMIAAHSSINTSTSKTDHKGNTFDKDRENNTSRAQGRAVGKAELKANVLGCKIEAEAETRLLGDAKMDITHTYINKSTLKNDNKGNIFNRDQVKSTSRAQGHAVGKAELKAMSCLQNRKKAETRLHVTLK